MLDWLRKENSFAMYVIQNKSKATIILLIEHDITTFHSILRAFTVGNA